MILECSQSSICNTLISLPIALVQTSQTTILPNLWVTHSVNGEKKKITVVVRSINIEVLFIYQDNILQIRILLDHLCPPPPASLWHLYKNDFSLASINTICDWLAKMLQMEDFNTWCIWLLAGGNFPDTFWWFSISSLTIHFLVHSNIYFLVSLLSWILGFLKTKEQITVTDQDFPKFCKRLCSISREFSVPASPGFAQIHFFFWCKQRISWHFQRVFSEDL